MKKKSLNVRKGRITFLFIVLLTVSVIYSCRKELKLTEQETKNELAAQNFPIAVAQNWFDAKKTVLSNKVRVNSDAAFLNRIAEFTPEWDKARTAVDTNFFVVEAPAKYASAIGFSTDSTKSNINGATRLLILKNKKTESLHAVLMQIHGDKGVDIKNVHYMDVPKDFSGNIFFTTLQGLFYNGYIYKKGKVTLVSSGLSTTKRSELQVLQEYVPGYCVETTTDWYDVTCWVEHNGDIERCEYRYMYTEIETYCVPGHTIPSGGGTVNLPDCPPGGGANPPVAVESVNGKKIVNVADPGDGGDGGSTGGGTPCNPVVVPPPPPRVIDSLDAKFKCAKALLAQLTTLKSDLSNLINKTFNTSGSKNITFKNTPANKLKGENGGALDGATFGYNISLNEDVLSNASNEYILAVMYHESLHAFLTQQYEALGSTAFKTKYPDVDISSSPTAIYGERRYYFKGDSPASVIVDGDPSHRTMAQYFTDKIVDAIRAYNPTFPPDRARALARGGIFNDPSIMYYNDAERDKTKGNSVGTTCTN